MASASASAAVKAVVTGLGALAVGGLGYLLNRSYRKTDGFTDIPARFDALVAARIHPRHAAAAAGSSAVAADAASAGAGVPRQHPALVRGTKVVILVAVPDRSEAEALNEDDRKLIKTNLSGRDDTDVELLQAVRCLGVAADDVTLQWVRLRDVDGLFATHTREQIDQTIVVNMCDGAEGADAMPGISVVRRLQHIGIRFTGAGEQFFAISTSKLAMKQLFVQHRVPTAKYCIVDLPVVCGADGQAVRRADGTRQCDAAPVALRRAELTAQLDGVGYPLIVKPDVSYASYGISDKGSVVFSAEQALAQCAYVTEHFNRAYCEQFVSGREFTCLVLCDGNGEVRALPCVERAFSSRLTQYERLITAGTYFDAECGCEKPTFDIAEADAQWDARLRAAAVAAFRAVGGTGYARVDMRLGWHTADEQQQPAATRDRVFVLEVNANCGIAINSDTVVGWSLYHANMSAAEMYAHFTAYAHHRVRGAGTSAGASAASASAGAGADAQADVKAPAKANGKADAASVSASASAAKPNAANAGASAAPAAAAAASALERHLTAQGFVGPFVDADGKLKL